MKKECIEILEKKIYFEKYIKKTYPLLYDEIIKFNSKLDISWLNKLYNYIFNIKIHPKCEYCNTQLNFRNKISIGYGQYCSKKCTSLATRDKVINTNLEKYGVEYPLQNKEIYQKLINTNLEKYGVISTLLDEKVQEKIKQTNLVRHGVENPSQSDLIKYKRKQTNLKKYGVENVFCVNIIKNKIKECNENKSHFEKEFIKEKTKKTNLKKYGVSTVLILEENRKKMINYNINHLGVKYPLQNEEIRNKSKKTILNKYGTISISSSNYYKECINTNLIKKYSLLLNLNNNNIKYNNNIFIIKNYCELHKKFHIKYDDLYNRIFLGCNNICTKCNPISKQSKIKENEINDYIKSLNVKYIRNDRKILSRKELDFYLPDNKLAIEFNGLYWHSNKYNSNNYHLDKTNSCEEQNIQLLHVFEDEWVYKKEIVKSIIKSKLGIIENKIFARKTEIKEITDNNLTKEFLENNHLQGSINSSIKLGLFHNNQLVSLMTFGKKRVALGNKTQNIGEYEMLRFCNKLNTQVVGGASKLLKYFTNNYRPKEILTFADRRYSNGNLYKELGFNYLGNTKPNYWYFKKNELVRYHRFNFRKDILVKEGFDSNKTEHQIMEEKGYLRIYDSGNMKFKIKC